MICGHCSAIVPLHASGILHKVFVDITYPDATLHRECYARGEFWHVRNAVPPCLQVRPLYQQHDIGEEEWQAGLDLLAKEYLKGEGENAYILV